MDDESQPPAPAGGEGPAVDTNDDDRQVAELALLRGWMNHDDSGTGGENPFYDEDDEEALEMGRGALDTIPLPPDEIDRLLVLTRGWIAPQDVAGRGRSERLITLIRAHADGAPQSTPMTSMTSTPPRAMRGIEILRGTEMMDANAILRSALMDRRSAARRRGSRWTLAALAVAAAVLPAIAIGAGAYFLRGHALAAENANALATPGHAGGPEKAIREVDGIEGAGAAFDEARAALTRLRSGVLSCARETIGVLPGTSPPIPTSLRLAKGEGYASEARDWGTPVWTCTGFTMPEPQRFQIQWQSLQSNTEGMGVAWIDEDADGVPDRALGFRATLKDRGEPEAGDIEILDPGHPIAVTVR